MTDETRLREIQWQLQRVQAVNEVLLIVYSTVGGPIQGLSSLSDRLKRMTSVLLEGMHSPSVRVLFLSFFDHLCSYQRSFTILFSLSICRGYKLEETLEGVSAQICCELNKSLTERGYPALTPALQDVLKGQICSITQKENPIRTLVGELKGQ